MKLNVKKGDNVIVLTGKDKGKKGRVIAADPDSGKVRVEDVNVTSKHKKARSAQDQGGIVKQEGVIDVSNVQIVCATCGKQTRVAHSVDEKGKKFRQCKKCSASLDLKAEKAAKKAAKKDKKKADAKVETEAKPEKKTVKKTTATKKPVEKAVENNEIEVTAENTAGNE